MFECKVVAYLVAGKILRSKEMKFEVVESKLSFLFKKQYYVEKCSCE